MACPSLTPPESGPEALSAIRLTLSQQYKTECKTALDTRLTCPPAVSYTASYVSYTP